LNKTIIIIVALGIIGVGMVIAGIFNLRDNSEQEDETTTKRTKKNSEAETNANIFANWMFGGHRGMEVKKLGRMRVQIGMVFIVVALLLAYVYIIQ